MKRTQCLKVALLATLALVAACHHFPARGDDMYTPHQPPMPEFSWDTVPLYSHMSKPEDLFTDEEIEFLARFPIVVLEKVHAFHRDDMHTEEAILHDAPRIKAANPKTQVFFYTNALIDYPGRYAASEVFLEHPEWLLRDKHGEPVLKKGRFKQYDLTNPDVRRWWLGWVRQAKASPAIDGIFVDAIPQIERYGEAKIEQWGAEKYYGMLAAGRELLRDSMQILAPDKHLIFNGVFGDERIWDHSGLAYAPYCTAMMVEHFALGNWHNKDDRVDPEVFRREVEAIRELSAQGKFVLVKGWCGDLHFQNPETRKLAPEERIRILRERIDFALAAYLIAAEPHCYFGYAWGWNHSAGWFEWMPEYDRPLGPPQGPAHCEGTVWTRQFEHASVRLDLGANEAEIEWGDPDSVQQ